MAALCTAGQSTECEAPHAASPCCSLATASLRRYELHVPKARYLCATYQRAPQNEVRRRSFTEVYSTRQTATRALHFSNALQTGGANSCERVGLSQMRKKGFRVYATSQYAGSFTWKHSRRSCHE